MPSITDCNDRLFYKGRREFYVHITIRIYTTRALSYIPNDEFKIKVSLTSSIFEDPAKSLLEW